MYNEIDFVIRVNSFNSNRDYKLGISALIITELS